MAQSRKSDEKQNGEPEGTITRPFVDEPERLRSFHSQLKGTLFDSTKFYGFVPSGNPGMVDEDLDLPDLITRVADYVNHLETKYSQHTDEVVGLSEVVRRLDDGWRPIFNPHSDRPDLEGYWYTMGTDNLPKHIIPMSPAEYWAYKGAMEPDKARTSERGN